MSKHAPVSSFLPDGRLDPDCGRVAVDVTDDPFGDDESDLDPENGYRESAKRLVAEVLSVSPDDAEEIALAYLTAAHERGREEALAPDPGIARTVEEANRRFGGQREEVPMMKMSDILAVVRPLDPDAKATGNVLVTKLSETELVDLFRAEGFNFREQGVVVVKR